MITTNLIGGKISAIWKSNIQWERTRRDCSTKNISLCYVSQYDNHIGEMTVRETLAFSARCQGVGQNYGNEREKKRSFK